MKNFTLMPEKPSCAQAEEIRAAVKSKYQRVAESPEGLFRYPVGKNGALGLGYDPSWLELVPADVVSRFVGVGNPFRIRAPKPGDRVLDAGCGCGFDTFIAASLAGPSGHAVGVDFTKEMLVLPRAVAESFNHGNAEFREETLEKLPFDDRSFDLVISNGVLNLIPDKGAVFAEIARVLNHGGALVGADLLVIETIPAEVLANTDAWST
jgi:arsenite methyltransferase